MPRYGPAVLRALAAYDEARLALDVAAKDCPFYTVTPEYQDAEAA